MANDFVIDYSYHNRIIDPDDDPGVRYGILKEYHGPGGDVVVPRNCHHHRSQRLHRLHRAHHPRPRQEQDHQIRRQKQDPLRGRIMGGSIYEQRK